MPSTLITPPRIAQTPVSMECIVTQYQQLKRADGNLLDTWMVMGEVVMVHIDENALEQGLYTTARQQPLLRAGGPADYFWIEEQQRLQMYRPK